MLFRIDSHRSLTDTEGDIMSRNLHIAAAIVAALSTPSLVHAQQAEQPPPREAGSNLETVVVTGSAISGGVKKLEASYNIVTANEEEIRKANPKSTADLLKISPGMWPESTGGQTGANIEIAGFPGGGDAPYFTTLMMGSPLVRHADAVVLRDHDHLPARRHDPISGDPARRPVSRICRRPDGRHRQLPSQDGHG